MHLAVKASLALYLEPFILVMCVHTWELSTLVFETGSLTDFLLSLMASKPQGCVCLSPSLPEAALSSTRRHAWLGHGC